MARILIVDDEEPIRNLIAQILHMDGYECTHAADASEAREFLKEQDFELVLCDINPVSYTHLTLPTTPYV